ncbi:unnamed protein product [Echinostoma caproni]|uniref:non-specific serine/threonine protein kinase n=1 Tax=Echinostoma caproni TaxID=27848 RepID=A0A183B1G2_9TREM|nr:unnamed protein product [Echinostoma caproni]
MTRYIACYSGLFADRCGVRAYTGHWYPVFAVLCDIIAVDHWDSEKERKNEKMAEQPEKRLGGKYHILRELGKGSSAVVYLAELVGADEKALRAIKCFRTDGLNMEEKQRLVDEASLLSKMKHPFILRFYESFFEGEKFFIVTEHCKGGDLAQFLRDLKESGHHLGEEQIGRWIVQLLLAIIYVHNAKVLHRDLKTSNIFLQDGGDVRIGDFGICRTLNSTQDLATTFVGTPYYMSPELLTQNSYNNKSDIWSVSVVFLFESILLRIKVVVTVISLH